MFPYSYSKCFPSKDSKARSVLFISSHHTLTLRNVPFSIVLSSFPQFFHFNGSLIDLNQYKPAMLRNAKNFFRNAASPLGPFRLHALTDKNMSGISLNNDLFYAVCYGSAMCLFLHLRLPAQCMRELVPSKWTWKILESTFQHACWIERY